MMWRTATWILICSISMAPPITAVKEDRNFWTDLGKDRIKSILRRRDNTGVAKNVILFVGDGMGLSTITAGRIFKGQLEKRSGEEGYLSFEKFNHVGLLKTYNVDKQVPDSAGTATALFSGVKTNYYIVGLDANAKKGICDPEFRESAKVKTIIDWAISAGKSTGVVTTTRITHATPASTYAGSFDRYWECDSKIPDEEKAKGCKDIARQLVEDEPGKSINVIFGGGEQVMVSGVNTTSACTRKDGKDLAYEWMESHKARNHNYTYVKNKNDLLKISQDADYVLGLFAHNHLPYDKDRNLNGTGEPSLEEMTAKAIQILAKNDKGFVLIVEGGRIDHAHHDNYAKIAIEEVVAFDKAIEKASHTTGDDTLILVTADHSHSFSVNGYPERGNPIDGIGAYSAEGFPYQTLSYINGPGYYYHRTEDVQNEQVNRTNSLNTWRNLNESAEANAESRDSLRTVPHHAGYWNDDETHGGEDVPVYAAGPMAHLVEGVHEQTHVAYVIAYSSCIGPFEKDCRTPVSSAGTNFMYNAIFLLVSVSFSIFQLLQNI